MRTYAFIDASNLFYGGRKTLGWSIDYEKFFKYLEDKYGVSQVFYFGGIEIHDFPFDYLKDDCVNIRELEKHLSSFVRENGDKMSEAQLRLYDRHYKRTKFYLKFEKFGYNLILKPVKTRVDLEGVPHRKANCDVDMTLRVLIEKNAFERAVFLSGDGDFLPVLKYLRQNKKEVMVLSRGPKTAKEIKQFAGDKFIDFTYLRELIKMEENAK